MSRPPAFQWRHFVPIAAVIVGVDVIVRILLSIVGPTSVALDIVADAVVVAAMAIPFVWLIVTRQLARVAEAVHVRADARMANVLATSMDGIITIDAGGKVAHFNTGAEKMFGFKGSEVLGRDINELIPLDTRWQDEIRLGGSSLPADASPVPGAITIVEGRRRGGDRFPAAASISRSEIDGEVSVTAILHDATEHRRVEDARRSSDEQFRAIFDRAPMGIALVESRTGRYLTVNPQYGRIAGRTVEDLLRRDWMSITHADDRAAQEHNTACMLRGEISGFQLEKRLLRPDGATVWIRLTAVQMLSNRISPGVHLAMADDITERRRTREALERARDRMRSLSRRLLTIQEVERRALARELHDEIGQALSAAKVNLQSLLRFPDGETMMPRVAESVGIVWRALEQVRSLSLRLHPPLLEDVGLLAALQWLVDGHARRSGLPVTFLGPASEAPLDVALRIACFRVVQGALDNIAKHAGARSAVVDLRVEGDELRVRVSDDGAGFDVAEAHDRASSGASLGMLGMEERAMLVGGGVAWRSTPGRGTEVLARFPLGFVPGGRRSAPETG